MAAAFRQCRRAGLPELHTPAGIPRSCGLCALAGAEGFTAARALFLYGPRVGICGDRHSGGLSAFAERRARYLLVWRQGADLSLRVHMGSRYFSTLPL